MMFPQCFLLTTVLAMGVGSSWVRVTNRPVVLQSEMLISYKIDNYNQARFNDIHCLLYAGSELLYAARVSGGEGVIRVPCGVLTHAGTHSVTLAYTNDTIIATTQAKVSWPTMAVSVPHRLETYTVDVGVRVSWTNNVCSPLLHSRDQAGLVLGGKLGLVSVWLQLERCDTRACDQPQPVNTVQLESFYRQHTNLVSLGCSEWGVAGNYRVRVRVEPDSERNISEADTIIATSKMFTVDWSSDYNIVLHKNYLGSCPSGDSVVVEVNYPQCILGADKIRLYSHSSKSLNRPKYLGEQRVIRGDQAVVFPCSMFNITSTDDVFCFTYVSVPRDGSVNSVKTTCLPVQDPGDSHGGVWPVWEAWGPWSACSVSCGDKGVRSRFRFCSDDSFNCQGPRVESSSCELPSCPSSTPLAVSTSQSVTIPARPTPVYGASPCECGCTYILHHSGQDDTSRDINIVSGDCQELPLTWTLKVPQHKQMLVNVHNISLSCPDMQLNIRDGVDTRDILLFTIHESTNVSVAVRTTSHVSRLELVSLSRHVNTSLCYAVIHIGVTIKEYSHAHVVSSLRSQHTSMAPPWSQHWTHILQLSSPVLMVVSLMLLIVICTLVMLCDYSYKKKKYSSWKANLDISRCPSPGGAEYQQCASMTDVSMVDDCDYTPLIPRSVSRLQVPAISKSVPVTPLTSHRRRRLLRRSETVEDYKLKLRKNKRKLSLPPKVSKSKLYMSVSTIDRDTEEREEESLKESLDKISDINHASIRLKKLGPKKRRKRRSVAESTDSDLTRTGSEATLQPEHSVSRMSSKASNSEFSSCVSLSQELEFDLYDCDIDNVMAAPGSMFAPAYWPDHDTPSLDLEMTDIFSPREDTCSPVTMRHGRQDTSGLVTSVTSDLTASISSAVSNSTLVGEEGEQTDKVVSGVMDSSCYHSDYAEDDSHSPVSLDKPNIMNITHIEEDIQFVDD